ncbi:MAG: universal stress protein [Thermodesulfobacteriota bacterium]|nr:universal stress protein [Thermodesulfobacteriota bacterium]
MEKVLLIAVDGSFHSRKAMEYAAGMGSIVKDFQYTILNVQPKISEFLLEDANLDTKSRASLKEVTKKNQENSDKILDESKKIMVKLGIDENRIKTVSQRQTMGTAKTIIDYGRQSLCDAIIIGNRGMSRLAESFIGSVTNSVLEHTKTTPVWAVGGDAKPSKILVGIDGSESALRAVDHVSFMVGDNPDSEITLLHITPRLRDYCTIEFDEEGEEIGDVITKGDRQCVESFYVHAKKRFTEAGLTERQINIKEIKSTLKIGKTIVEEIEKSGFSTVVVGRRGINNSFFMGSVSSYVLTNAKDCAVWLVP